jgi:hypothetical protein
MKSVLKLTLLIGIFLLSSIVSACLSTNQITPSPTYWNVNQYGTITTDDVSRLQKEIPISIVLPKYLPDGLKDCKFELMFQKEDESPDLSITYFYLRNNKEIFLIEGLLSDTNFYYLPGYIEKNAKLNSYVPLTLAGTQIYERIDGGWVMPRFGYMFVHSNQTFSGHIYGYEQDKARKIIESIIK